MAMNIIQKDKKEIKWKGLPTQEVKQEYLALQIGNPFEDTMVTILEKDQCEERIRRKREHLEELALHVWMTACLSTYPIATSVSKHYRP
jgi:hypothetical protein